MWAKSLVQEMFGKPISKLTKEELAQYHNARNRKNYALKKEERRENRRDYYKRNREHIREYQNNYYKNKKEEK